MNDILSVKNAIQHLTSHQRVGLVGESIYVNQATGRVIGKAIVSGVDVPAENESLRDGFAVHYNHSVESVRNGIFENIGEIEAGGSGDLMVNPHQVCKIMTGAIVPANCYKVVPQEFCKVKGAMVSIPIEALDDKHSFIKKRGSEFAKGQLLCKEGTILSTKNILECSSAGIKSVEVFQRPKVSYFCSGHELTTLGNRKNIGQKYSTNHILLSSLIRRFGCKENSLGLVADNISEIKQILEKIDKKSCDIVLSTGGTGPGKYDLLQEAFEEAGGEMFSTSLSMRPGKTFLTGQLNDVIYCGLPGPPTAVETLFYEIIGPILVALQGVLNYEPAQIQAFLVEDIHTRSLEVVRLKGGIVSFEHGKCFARLAGKSESSNCNLVLEPDRTTYRRGELITARLKTSPFDGSTFDSLGNKNLPAPQL